MSKTLLNNSLTFVCCLLVYHIKQIVIPYFTEILARGKMGENYVSKMLAANRI